MKKTGEPSGADLSAPVAKQWLAKAQGIQLVDVRSVEEYKDGHLSGALLMPLPTLPVRAAELDRHRPVLLYCAAGGRSAQALRFLQSQGFGKVKHLADGIFEWTDAGYPVER